MKATSKSHHGGLTELNITPLLDLVFVLLVIFIITTPQMMNNLEMALPSGKPPPPAAKPPKINRIAIDDSGQIFLNDQPLSLPAFHDALQRLKAEDPNPSVVVKASDNVSYQQMVNVLDALRQYDIAKVGLATSL